MLPLDFYLKLIYNYFGEFIWRKEKVVIIEKIEKKF